MGATTDLTVTPRPIYHADGTKSPGLPTPARRSCTTELVGELGEFPLFTYWGPTARDRVVAVDHRRGAEDHDRGQARPDAGLHAAPGLRPAALRPGRARRPRRPRGEIDAALKPLLDFAAAGGHTVVALSEYGITNANRPVDINRALRREGLLNVYVQAGMEYLDPWTSRAFAVADHQVAHVYVADPADIPRVRDIVAGLSGVDVVLDREEQAGIGIDHERAGRAGRDRRAGRVVHLLLLARRRPRAGLRADRRDPPQARLRPGRAVLRPERPGGEAQGGVRAGPQEARPAVLDAGRPARPGAGARQPRPAARRARGRAGAAVLGPGARARKDPRHRSQGLVAGGSSEPSRTHQEVRTWHDR